MPALVTSGTVTTDGTEQTLTTQTTPAVYVFSFSALNMVNGDAVEVRIYTKMLSGDAYEQMYCVTYVHGQSDEGKLSEPVPVDIDYKVTIKRVAGTDRAYKWKLLSL
jgi:hypothetical protein